MFSALIPVFNHERYIYEAIHSCIVDALVTEILIVDDASHDRSVEIIESFSEHPKVRILDNGGMNKGAHNRINQLCRAATNDWLAVLNSDDAFVPHRFQLARQIIREVDPALITGSISIMDEGSKIIGRKRGPADPEYAFPKGLKDGRHQSSFLAMLLNQNFVATTSNMIFSRQLFEKLGGFRDYRYIHDWDFALRAYVTDVCHFSPAALTKYRVHSNNTIKENPLFVDGEITRMFADLFLEFGPKLKGQQPAIALRGNTHLDFGARDYLAQMCERTEASAQIGELNTSGADGLTAVDRASTVQDSYDRRVLLAREIIRLVSGRQDDLVFERTCIPRTTPRLDPNAIYVPNLGTDDASDYEGARDFLTSEPKPVIFVLSGFFAVGGVERNTVEIMRQLRADFEFVVITFEPHFTEIGSLHHQLDEIDVMCVDLAHLVAVDSYEHVIRGLTGLYPPHAVWIINGATWIAENAGRLRCIFAGSKIFDQQVYDTEAGWIQEFHRPGVLAADQFIAVNKKIETTFRERFNIPSSLISQIYPALSFKRVAQIDTKRASRQSIEIRFGLENGKTNIGFIGRLTSQKRPERFLDLAKRFLDRPEIQFVLVGTGPLDEVCQNEIEANNLANTRTIRFFEDVSDIGAFLDGLVICSDYEGLPIALLESMSMGIPFLSTDVGDIRAVNDTYGGGRIVENWNGDDVRNETETWLGRLPELRATLNEQRENIKANFSANALSGRYGELFKS